LRECSHLAEELICLRSDLDQPLQGSQNSNSKIHRANSITFADGLPPHRRNQSYGSSC